MKISGVFAIPFCIFIGEATLSENIAINSAKRLEVKAGGSLASKETMRRRGYRRRNVLFEEVWDIKAAPDGRSSSKTLIIRFFSSIPEVTFCLIFI